VPLQLLPEIPLLLLVNVLPDFTMMEQTLIVPNVNSLVLLVMMDLPVILVSLLILPESLEILVPVPILTMITELTHNAKTV
jgi:hypothetical protein